MKTFKIFQLHSMLRKRLGDDLTYSIVLDTENTISVYISAHASKTRVNQKPLYCKLDDNDMQKEVFILANEIANMYKDKFDEIKGS